jgi:hypothetical protein
MRLLLAFLLLLGAEAGAQACSCASPSDVEPRQWAQDALRGAAAIVEVDVLSGYGGFWRAGERVRVRRLLAGSAPPRFEVNREREPSGAACDHQLFAGDRHVLILYPVRARDTRLWGWWWPRYRIQSSCGAAFLWSPRHFAALLQAAAKRR